MHRIVRFLFPLCLLAFGALPTEAKQPTPGAASDTPAELKQAHATRVEQGRIHLDGRLDEEIWQTAQPLIDFEQAEPIEGAAPTDPMEVRFLYDDTALWIGARMRSVNARGIQAPMSRRDSGDQSEYLQIELDTYHDRRTAYMFGVTASGVRLDHFHPTDDETDFDVEFDPVWQAKTAVDADGWTAEMWVPFSQLRFNDAPERVWGLNVKRWRPTINEQDYWVVIGRTNQAWASRFGELRGIEGVRPKERLEVLPYVASSSRVTGDRDLNNPFDNGLNLTGRVGADMKVGLGSNLTLEATINPDFGQIEADPAEVNLTVFETIFTEKRPFFIEGNNVLQAGTSNFYYSRRIGARPTGPATGDYVDYPETSTILGAAKLSGRLKSGTSVGFLGAVTSEESARIQTAGRRSDVSVAPRTEWAVGRAIQEFGNGASTLGAHLTMVHRELDDSDPLASTLVRNAITTGADTRIRFDHRQYEIQGNVGLTFVDGTPASIARVQQASGHFFQRVDQPSIRFDPTRTALSGAQIQGDISRISGRHWLWNNHLQIETPEFEPSDFGRLNYAGDLTTTHKLTYRETRPGKYLRAYSFTVSLVPYWYFDTDLGVRNNLNSNNSVTFNNFWIGSFNVTRYFRGQDTQLTRGGPAMGTPLGLSETLSLQNRAGSKTQWNGSLNYKSNELGDSSWNLTGSITARPSPSLQFSFTPTYLVEKGTSATLNGPINRQYLQTIDGGRPETYGRRYVFGLVDRTTLSSQFRVSYTFKPDVTLDVYAEPFAASGQYRGYGELATAHGRDLRMYGTDGTTIVRQPDGSLKVTDGAASFSIRNQDFNVRSYRSNVVLKWEWRPGSTLYVVWQQNRASQIADGNHVGVGDLFDSWSAPGDNIFAIKTTVWLSR
jgi:hypothetical protein